MTKQNETLHADMFDTYTEPVVDHDHALTLCACITTDTMIDLCAECQADLDEILEEEQRRFNELNDPNFEPEWDEDCPF